MCDLCWREEIASFRNADDWREFSEALTKKMDEGLLCHNSVTNSFSIYECLSCGEKWKVKTPYENEAGYLLKASTRVDHGTGPKPILQIILIGIVAILFAKLMQYIFG